MDTMTQEQNRFHKLVKLCAYYNHQMNLEGTDDLEPRVEAVKEFFMRVPADKIDMFYDLILKRKGDSAPFFPMRHEVEEIYDYITREKMEYQHPARIGCDPELTEEGVYKKFMEQNNILLKSPDNSLTNEQFYKDYEQVQAGTLPFFIILKKYGFERCYELIIQINIPDDVWEKKQRKWKSDAIRREYEKNQEFHKKPPEEIKNPDYFQDI